MKTYKLNNIEVTEDQLRQIIKENPELWYVNSIPESLSGMPWRAEESGEYWYVDSGGDVNDSTELADTSDAFRYSIGNYYETEKQAVKALERQKAIRRVRLAILKANGNWTPDYTNSTQVKYLIYHGYQDGKFGISYNWQLRNPLLLPVLFSKAATGRIIKSHESDLKLIFEIE